MKKIFLKIMTVVVSSLLLTSCDADSTGGVSRVTVYPTLELNGSSVINIKKGESFTDPGVVALEGTTPITATSTVVGAYRGGKTLDTNVADTYRITYSASNKDGFSGSVVRTVNVVDDGDLVNSISGLYTATTTRNGVLTAQYTNMKYVQIWQNANGTYEISDGIGLYYAVGRAYGDGYLARPVIVTANSIPNNNYTISTFTVGTFVGGCVMSGLTADPAAQTVKFSTVWSSGYTFDVVLKKVQI